MISEEHAAVPSSEGLSRALSGHTLGDIGYDPTMHVASHTKHHVIYDIPAMTCLSLQNLAAGRLAHFVYIHVVFNVRVLNSLTYSL
jgi:hypothetical protein